MYEYEDIYGFLVERLGVKRANAARWLVEYPVHRMPRRRYDVLVDRVVALIVIATFLALIIHRIVAPAPVPK
jgi:hypothetical protein